LRNQRKKTKARKEIKPPNPSTPQKKTAAGLLGLKERGGPPPLCQQRRAKRVRVRKACGLECEVAESEKEQMKVATEHRKKKK